MQQDLTGTLQASCNLFAVLVHNCDHVLIQEPFADTRRCNIHLTGFTVQDGKITFKRIDQALLVHQLRIEDDFFLDITIKQGDKPLNIKHFPQCGNFFHQLVKKERPHFYKWKRFLPACENIGK